MKIESNNSTKVLLLGENLKIKVMGLVKETLLLIKTLKILYVIKVIETILILGID